MDFYKDAIRAGQEVRRRGQLPPDDQRDPALQTLADSASEGIGMVEGPRLGLRRPQLAEPVVEEDPFAAVRAKFFAERGFDPNAAPQAELAEPVVEEDPFAAVRARFFAERGFDPNAAPQAEPEGEGTFMGDVGRSVARGGIALGGGFYELFNLASQGGLDTGTKRAFGVSGTEAISSSRESLNQADSPELQRQRQQLAEADGFWDSFSTVLTNPRLMGSMALEMLPQVVTVAGAAKSVASRAMNSAYQKALTAGATKEAATTAAEQAGKRAALYTVMGVNPALESGMASGEIRAEVMSMSEADLQNSPQYQALIKQHGDTEEGRATARARLANDAANAAALVTAPISLAATAVFGGIEPNIASRAARSAVTSRLGIQAARPTIGEVAKGVAVGGAREMAQESVEEGGSQFGQNVGAVTSGADPDRSLLQDVPEAAGAGGALGFGVGSLGSIRRPQIGSQAPAQQPGPQPGAQPGAQALAPGDQPGDQNLAAPTGLRMDAATFDAQFQSEEIVPVLSALYYQAGTDGDTNLQTRIAEVARRRNVFEDLNETSQNEQLVTRGFNVLDASGAGFTETFLNTINKEVQQPDNVAVAPKAEGISIDQDQADIDQFSFSDPADNTGAEDFDPRPREEVIAGFQRNSQFIATQPPAARQALARSAIQGMLRRGFSQEEANEVFGQFFTPYTLEERQSIIDNVTQAIERQKATNPNLQVPAEIQVSAAPPVVARIADALGIKAFGYNAGSEVSRGGFIAEGPNGRYIAINTNERVEDLQLFILGHEVFHELVRRQPNAARELIQEITSYLESGKASAKLDDFRAKLATKYDTNAINEEVAADLMGYLFTQQGFWGEVAKRNPSLVEQILEVLNNVIAKAKASLDKVLKEKSPGAARVQAAKELLKSATRVRGMMAGFIAENAANTGSAVGDSAAMDLDVGEQLYSKTESGRVKAVFFKDLKRVYYSRFAWNAGDAGNTLTQQQFQALELHEIGAHYAVEQMLGKDGYKTLLSDLRKLRSSDQRVDEAYKAVPQNTPDPLVDHEALGYLVENYANMSIVQRFMQMLSDWYQSTFKNKTLTASQIQSLTKQAFNKYKKDIDKVFLVQNISSTPTANKVRVNFQDALNANPEAMDFLDFMQQFKDKTMLSGSLALSAQRAVFRPSNQQIHDLDFRVINKDDLQEILGAVAEKYPNSGVSAQFSSNKTQSDVISISLNRDDPNALAVDFFTRIDGEPYGSESVAHSYVDANGESKSINLLSGQEIFEAKLNMNRVKDVDDAIASESFDVSFSKEALQPNESPEEVIVRLAGENKKASAAKIFKDAGLFQKTKIPFEAYYLQAQKKAKDAASKPQESVATPATAATPLQNVPKSDATAPVLGDATKAEYVKLFSGLAQGTAEMSYRDRIARLKQLAKDMQDLGFTAEEAGATLQGTRDEFIYKDGQNTLETRKVVFGLNIDEEAPQGQPSTVRPSPENPNVMEGTRRPPAQPTTPDVLEQERMAKETEARRKKARIEAKKIVIKPEKPRQIPRQGEIGETDTRSYAARAQEIMTTLVSPGSAAQQVAQLETLMDQISADPENRSKQRSQVEYIFKIMSDSGALSDEDSQALRKAASIKEELDVFRDAISRIRAKDLSNRAGAVRRNIRRVKGALTALRQEMEAAGVQPNVIDRILLEREQGVDNLISGDIDSVEQIEESIPEVSEPTPESRELFGDPAQAAAQVVDSILNQGEIKGYRDLTALAREADQAGVGNLDILNELRLRGIPQDQIDQFARLQSFPAYRYTLDKFMRDNSNLRSMSARDVWLGSLDRMLSVMQKSGMNPDTAMAELSPDEAALYKRWKENRKKLRTRLDKAVRTNGAGEYLFNSVEDAFPDALFNEYLLSEMRDPNKLPADVRSALQDLAGADGDLVAMWYSDVAEAMSRRPDLKQEILNVMTPTEQTAFNEWKARQDRIVVENARRIAQSPAASQLFQLKSFLPEDVYNAFADRLAVSDQAQLPAVLQAAYEIAEQNRAADTVRGDVDEVEAAIMDAIYGQDEQAADAASDDTRAPLLEVDPESGEIVDQFTQERGAVDNPQDLDNYRFKRGRFSGVVSAAQIASHLNRITSQWPTAPNYTVLNNPNQLPEGLQADITERLGTHGAKGVMTPDGQVYVFSDFIENLADAEFVLFHELYGHLGLRAFLGDKLDPFLENQYKLNQKVRQEADALIAEARKAGRGMSVLEATEEAIADLAVNAQEPTLWMKVVDALRKFFKSIGMNSVADWMKSRASNNLAFTLSMARKAARTGAIPPMSGAPSDIRFAANKLPVEIFATKDGKTTAYGFYNAMTHNWTVFYNKGGLDPQNFAIQTFDNYQDAHDQAKLMGRVVAAKDHPNRRAKTPGSFDIGPIPYPSNMANASWWKKIGRLAQIKIQSKNLPIYEVVNYVRSKGGFTTLDRDVKLYNGRIRPYFDQFTEQMLTPISEALNGIKNANFSYDFRDQDGKTYQYKESELVGLYLTALHAKERNARVKAINPTNDKGSGLFDSEARTILSDLQASPIAAQLNEISTITQRLSEMKVNYMHMTGLINEVQAKALKDYAFYVNLSGNKKNDVDFIDEALLGGRAVNLRGSDVRRALGRETLAVDVLENTLNSYLSTLVRGQKNVVAQSVYQLFNDHPDPNFAVINPYFTAKKLDVDKLIQDKIFYSAIADNNNPVDGKAYLKALQARIGNGFSAAEAANEVQARLEDAYRQNFISASQLQGLKVRLNNSVQRNLSISADGYVTEVADDSRYNDENVFIAKVNGKPVAIEFREGVDGGDRMGTFISALHGINPPQNGMTLEAIATFNRFIGQLITSRNLSWIPVNWIRDIGTAFFNAASDPKVGQKLARQMFKESTNAYSVAVNNMMDAKFAKDNGPVFKFMKKFFRRPPSAADQAMWQEFVSSGAQVFFMDRRDMKEQLAEMERVINPRTGLLGTWDAYGKFADFLGVPAEASARFAAYKTLRNAGWTKDDAAVYAKEITVNFEQGGSSRWIRSLFMFANPSIQGTARMFRDASFKNKAFMTALAGLAGFGVLMGFVGRSLGSDDEDENGVNDLDQIPRYKRATSVVIAPGMPLGSPIPMPYGWNVFYAFGTFLSDSIFGDTPVQQTASRTLQSAVDSFYPFGQSDSSTVFGTFLKSITPTPFAPVVDMAMNESKFGGPIVKGDNPFVHADEANAYSNFNSASPISVYMARALNRISGGSQYDSGAIDLNPGYIDYMASSLLPGLPSDIGRTVNLGINAAMGKDLKNVPIPLVDRFGSKISNGWDAGAFRRAIAFVDTKYKDAITSQGERKDRILEEHPNLGNAKGALSRIDQMIRTMRTNLRAIEMNPDIPMREKVEARNEVEALEKEYYKMGVQAAVTAGFRDPVLQD